MRKGLLLILSILLPSLLWAESISQETALQKASSFLEKRQPASTRSKKAELRLATASEDYFIFNVGQKEGFVIISGDDCAPDIIGYADKGQIDPQNMPDNMRSWLQGYADQISWMKAHGVKAESYKATTRAPKSSISPLVASKWNQYSPYNDLCPVSGTERTVTGCVATAMAQIMYYHKWPTEASTAIPAYTTGDLQIAMEALPAYTFNWSKMYPTYSGSENGSEVAKLMLYCGQSVEMNYNVSSTGGSGASSAAVVTALKKYFGYDGNARNLERSNYSYTDWLDIVYDELSNRRPVLYAGQSTGGGHAFVCDGFDEDDYFHINWGWGGTSDGYFRLSLLSPKDQGAGGSTTSDGYNMQQDICVGIMPYAGTSPYEALTVENIKQPATSSFSRSSSSEDFVLVSVDAGIRNWGSKAAFDIGWGLYNGSNLLTPIQISENVSLGTGYGYTDYKRSIEFGAGIADGTYQLKPISKVTSSDTWHPDFDSEVYYIDATISGNSLTLAAHNAGTVNLTDVSISFDGDLVKGEAKDITISIKNTGDRDFHGDITLALMSNGTIKDKLGGKSVDITQGETKVFTLNITPKVAGTYDLTVINGVFKAEGAIASQSVTISEPATSSDVNLQLQDLSTNIDGENIYGNTFKISFKYKNNSSEAYNNGISIRLCRITKWENDGGTIHYSYTYDKEKNFSEAIASGETKSYSAEFEGLEYDTRYFVQYGYYTYDSSSQKVFNATRTDIITPAHGFITYDADGKVTASAPTASVTVPADAAVVDLRGQTTVTGITPNSNPNCIYLLDAGATVPSGISTNIVKGATAASISLTDGYAFYTPIDFTAEAITYKRTITIGNDGAGNGWTTINLPFDVSTISAADKGTIDFFHSKNDTGKSFWVHNFSSDEGSKVKFGYTDQIKANTPYLMSVPGDTWGASFDLRDKELTFSGSYVPVQASKKAVVSGNNYKFYGTYRQESLTNSYILNAAGNSFEHTSGTIEAFRGYFAPSAILTSLPTSLSIGFGDDGSTGIFNILNVPQKTNSAIYNLRGEKVGTTDDMPRLPKGIYIINGKKIIK